jgi:hypothetical protein
MSAVKYVVKSQSEIEHVQVISFRGHETKIEAMDWVTTLMLRTNDENTKWDWGQAEEFLESSDVVQFFDLQNPEHLRQCEEDGYCEEDEY